MSLTASEKFAELEANEKFTTALKNASSYEEISSLFREEGVDVSAEALREIAKREKEGELIEEDLEDISGGIGPVTIGLMVIGAYAVYRFTRGYIDGARCK